MQAESPLPRSAGGAPCRGGAGAGVPAGLLLGGPRGGGGGGEPASGHAVDSELEVVSGLVVASDEKLPVVHEFAGQAVACHLHVEPSRPQDGFGLAAVTGPVDFDGEGHPALLRELREGHFGGDRRRLELRSDGLHHSDLFGIGVATVVLVGEPASVGVCLDVEPSAGESERQRGISALFDLPAGGFPGLPDRASLAVGGFDAAEDDILLDDDRIVQGDELLRREFSDAAVRVRHECAVGHSVPLCEDRRDPAVELLRDVDGEGIAPCGALGADSLAVVVDGLHLLRIGIRLGGEGVEILRHGVAVREFRTAFGLAGAVSREGVVLLSEGEAVGGRAVVQPGVVAAQGFLLADSHGDPLAVDHLFAAGRIGLDVHPFGDGFRPLSLGGGRRCKQQHSGDPANFHVRGRI